MCPPVVEVRNGHGVIFDRMHQLHNASLPSCHRLLWLVTIAEHYLQWRGCSPPGEAVALIQSQLPTLQSSIADAFIQINSSNIYDVSWILYMQLYILAIYMYSERTTFELPCMCVISLLRGSVQGRVETYKVLN